MPSLEIRRYWIRGVHLPLKLLRNSYAYARNTTVPSVSPLPPLPPLALREMLRCQYFSAVFRASPDLQARTTWKSNVCTLATGLGRPAISCVQYQAVPILDGGGRYTLAPGFRGVSAPALGFLYVPQPSGTLTPYLLSRDLRVTTLSAASTEYIRHSRK